MSHGVFNANPTFQSNSHSTLSNINSASKVDIGRQNSFGTMFGAASSPWGSNSIWQSNGGSTGLTNGFGSKDITQNTLKPGERQQAPANQLEADESKTGSGSLLQGSTTWREDKTQNDHCNRSLSHITFGAQGAQRQLNMNGAGLQNFGAARSQKVSAFTSTAPAIDLTISGHRPPTFVSEHESRSNPPPVFTKLNRSDDPAKARYDSAVSSSNDPSPTNTRFTPGSFRQYSEPTSRGTSQPPSRHSNQQPAWPNVDFARSSQGNITTKSREPSFSQRNGTYSTFNEQSADHLSTQLSRLRFGSNDARSSFKPRASTNTFVPQTAVWEPSSFQGHRNAFDTSEDLEDIDGFGFANIGPHGIQSPIPSSDVSNYDGTTWGTRYIQSPTHLDYRGSSGFVPNIPAARSFDLPTGPKSPTEWQNYVNGGATQAQRRSPASDDQQPYLDPRMQQALAVQLRNPYAPIYNPYAMANGLQVSDMPPYLSVVPMAMNGVDPSMANREPPSGDNVQSALMYEFKSNTKTRRYELKDIYDHIAEFSGDQHGSRFIQTKLETANSDEKDRVFREIQPNAIQLMTDVFGNYVIQKFFEHGDQTHKKILANKMRGQVLNLSLQMYGCRVVQKALDHVLVDQQAMLLGELENHVLKCVKDQNGNHVIQKAIERCPPHTIGFIIDAFRGQVQHLSIHPYGCRVIQRCLERCDTPSKSTIMVELMDGIQGMISDQYGNYVVQHVVSKDEGQGRQRVLQIVLRGLEGYSKHKFASNVVEKCLEQADDTWRRQVVYTLADCSQRRVEGDGFLASMIKDNYGNYVIQKLLDTLSSDDFAFFVELLQPAVNQAKRTGCGKQLMSVEKKMHRLPPRWNGPAPPASYGHNPYQLPLPTPPFASHYASATTTPPPLTSDTQSLQSSAIPSINGDAVEGADCSRKGSEPSSEGRYV
ncbi:putative Pumilio like protein [Hortaea werneckii]|nr:putative Pumilio like protein [Hortaea werneckii]KAI7059128.1 putative Pumilio like protein [Hortaea werneckii]KAI7209426.1 putative Pumilio like protein [Hortaea werneckii]KAI7292619.1 putative Pumilio like protein [Hortaea werneckii]